MTSPAQPAKNAIEWTCRPQIKWVVEPRYLRLLDLQSGRERILEGPPAVLWDLLSRGHSLEDIVPMMKTIAALDETAIRELISGCLEKWIEDGYLMPNERHG